MGGVHNEIVYGANVDFREVWPPVGQMVLDGQLLIGATVAPFIRAARPTATDGSFTWTFGAGTLDGSLTQATTTQKGGSTIATNAETLTGSDTSKIVTPDDLKAKLGAQTLHAVILGGGNTAALNASTVGVDGTIFIGNTGSDPGFASTIPGSITLAKSISGSDISFITSNLSNTASSTANIEALVAGSSAGDPYFTANINGVQAWAWGADNSDSDAFVLSAATGLGSNNVMRVSTAGQINYPLQPTFFAGLTNVSNVTGDGTSYQLLWDQEIYDVGGNLTTGVFTAPVTGKYLFTMAILGQQLIATMTTTTAISTSNRTIYSSNDGAFIGNNQFHQSVICDMDAGDTCVILLIVSNGTKVVDIYGSGTSDPRTNFSGQLIA